VDKKIWIMTFSMIFINFLLLSGCGKKGSEIGEKVGQTRTKAFQKFKSVTHQDNLMYLKNKLNTYKRQNGRYPDSLQKLVDEGFIERIPEPPAGMQYDYDPATGKITLK